MTGIRCVIMRGGTSRGLYLRAEDLPADIAARDRVLMGLMGCGHELQVDGLGGAQPQTSKIAIVGRSARQGADVDYLFAQAGVRERVIDTSPNCGNLLAAVGPFAIEEGMVAAAAPLTPVRIYNVNTRTLIEATVETPGGRVTYAGDAAIAGVPGTAAPVRLAFLDAAGAKTGRLLPTGAPRDLVQGLAVSCIDMAMPIVVLRAADLGRTGHETPLELDGDAALLARLEALRREAGALMGLGEVRGKVVPKLALVAPAARGGSFAARYFTPDLCHRSLAATGAVCLATALVTPGTLVHELLPAPPTVSGRRLVVIEHPSGEIPVELELTGGAASPAVTRASLIRTARRIMAGEALLPA